MMCASDATAHGDPNGKFGSETPGTAGPKNMEAAAVWDDVNKKTHDSSCLDDAPQHGAGQKQAHVPALNSHAAAEELQKAILAFFEEASKAVSLTQADQTPPHSLPQQQRGKSSSTAADIAAWRARFEGGHFRHGNTC